MLHRVLDDPPTAFGLPGCYRIRGTALTKGELEDVLDSAGPNLPLTAVEEALQVGKPPPPGTVLTFDDGYREHLDLVAPLLAARGVTGTFYVATGLHGAGRDVAAVDAWYWVLDHATRSEAVLGLPDGGRFQGRLDMLEGKSAWAMGPAKAALLEASADQQTSMIRALAEAAGCELPTDLASRLYLRPDEWPALKALGMQVGAHSVSHPRLTTLGSDELASEVERSVAAVAGLGGRVPFAYPDGAYDERVTAAVRDAGATSAVTCEAGSVTSEASLLRLPRAFVTAHARGASDALTPS